MAIPLLPLIAAGAAGAAGGTLFGGMSSATISPWLSPRQIANTYDAYNNFPALLPGINELISAWNSGLVGESNLRTLLRRHGIENRSDGAPSIFRREAWNPVIEANRNRFPMDRAIYLWKAGLLPEATVDELIDRNGYARESLKDLFKTAAAPVTPEQSLVLLNRAKIAEPQAREYLRRNGMDRPEDQTNFLALRNWFPGPSDIIQWAVKDVWQQEIVNRFQYDAEFPSIFQFLMELQGAGWKPSNLGYTVDPSTDITIPQAMWRAHWNVISPTQAMDAVHRLRPIAPGSQQSRTAGIPAFTRDDFNLILKTADYPPIMREWLFGLSFTPLSRIDIRRFSRLLPWTKTDIEARYMDLGYSPQDAVVQAEFTLAERHAMETGRDRARIETVVRQLYEECVYSPGEAAAALKAARLKTPQQQAEFGALATAQQQAEGLADPAISYLLGSLDAKKKLNLAKKTKSAVRSAVLRREVDLNTAQLLLSQAGITGNCAAELLQLWQLEMMIKGKQASASQILRWFVRGAITGQEVALRLSLLGYSNRDITAMLAVAGQDISLAVARQRKQLATDERGRIQAIRTELRLLRQQRKEAIADLNASATKAQIVKFYSSGLVSREEALAALIQRGVFPRDADLFLDEVDNAKSKVSDKIQSGPPSNGQASKSGNQGTEEGNTEL